jgi:hypothetical protein
MQKNIIANGMSFFLSLAGGITDLIFWRKVFFSESDDSIAASDMKRAEPVEDL